jgi:D-alanyl-D-alanine carboxypeptidase/D-alanyl-D-alanine-endopeptidase (penicillin-binding protein 4)
MSVLLRLMDVPSDDLFAELLTKQLGVRFGGGVGSIAAGADVISQTLSTDYGIHPLIQDGSGLSRGDRSDPFEVIKLLDELWHTPTGRVLVASLPVVGVEGTVQNIALKTAAVRNCAAKTGTLDTATNLAGYCRSREGDMLAFAFFVQGPFNYVAIPLIGDMVAAVARY